MIVDPYHCEHCLDQIGQYRLTAELIDHDLRSVFVFELKKETVFNNFDGSQSQKRAGD